MLFLYVSLSLYSSGWFDVFVFYLNLFTEIKETYLCKIYGIFQPPVLSAGRFFSLNVLRSFLGKYKEKEHQSTDISGEELLLLY